MIILILFCHSKLQKDATQQLVSTCTVHLWKAIQDIGQAFTVIYNRHIWYIHTVCKFDMVRRCSMLLLWHIRQAISRYPESSQWPCYSRHEAGDTTWSALALRMTVLQNASLYHVYTKGSKGITCLSYFTSQTRLSLKRSEKSIHRFTRNHFLWSTLINHLSYLSSKQPAAKRPLPYSHHPVACTFPCFTCVRHQRPARELLLPMQQVGVVAETWSAFSHAKVGTINGV